VREIWLDRSTLDRILGDLEHLYARPTTSPAPLDASGRQALVAQYRDLRAKGLLRDHDLTRLCRLLAEEGETALSDEVSNWRLASTPR